jgi:hypothetical protein
MGIAQGFFVFTIIFHNKKTHVHTFTSKANRRDEKGIRKKEVYEIKKVYKSRPDKFRSEFTHSLMELSPS